MPNTYIGYIRNQNLSDRKYKKKYSCQQFKTLSDLGLFQKRQINCFVVYDYIFCFLINL